MRFENLVVVITGATGGLGQGLARAFAKENAKVVVAARNAELGATLASEIGNESFFVSLDVTSEDSWIQLIHKVEEKIGPVNILINNAAYLAVGGIETVQIDDWKKVIETNLTGCFLGIRSVAPSMRKAGGGSIVNISSIAGLHPTPNLVAYGASKWGIRGLNLTAAAELATSNIRVNAVHPGIIDTPLARNPQTGDELVPTDHFAIPRMASVEEIVKYVLFVASDDAAFSTGSEFVADGGFALGSVR